MEDCAHVLRCSRCVFRHHVIGGEQVQYQDGTPADDEHDHDEDQHLDHLQRLDHVRPLLLVSRADLFAWVYSRQVCHSISYRLSYYELSIIIVLWTVVVDQRVEDPPFEELQLSHRSTCYGRLLAFDTEFSNSSCGPVLNYSFCLLVFEVPFEVLEELICFVRIQILLLWFNI